MSHKHTSYRPSLLRLEDRLTPSLTGLEVAPLLEPAGFDADPTALYNCFDPSGPSIQDIGIGQIEFSPLPASGYTMRLRVWSVSLKTFSASVDNTQGGFTTEQVRDLFHDAMVAKGWIVQKIGNTALKIYRYLEVEQAQSSPFRLGRVFPTGLKENQVPKISALKSPGDSTPGTWLYSFATSPYATTVQDDAYLPVSLDAFDYNVLVFNGDTPQQVAQKVYDELVSHWPGYVSLNGSEVRVQEPPGAAFNSVELTFGVYGATPTVDWIEYGVGYEP